MGDAAVIHHRMCGELACWVGVQPILGNRQTMGEIRYQLFYVSERVPAFNWTNEQSNSLPIAIVSSLAYTLDKDLYWDNIDGDSAQRVMSRGILYLLIFSQ